MSERDLINRRVESMRAKQRREAEVRANLRRQELEKAERIRKVRGLAVRFVTWATLHGIPTESAKLYKPHKPNFRDWLRGHGPEIDFVQKSEVWKLAASEGYNPAKDGSYYPITLYVDKGARLYQGALQPLTDKQLNTGNPNRFQPEDIHQRIAELCVEHGIEWDV